MQNIINQEATHGAFDVAVAGKIATCERCCSVHSADIQCPLCAKVESITRKCIGCGVVVTGDELPPCGH